MPFSGYLQDLVLLADQCLLPLSDQEAALIDDNSADSTPKLPCPLDLTPGIVESMMMNYKAEAREADEKAGGTQLSLNLSVSNMGGRDKTRDESPVSPASSSWRAVLTPISTPSPPSPSDRGVDFGDFSAEPPVEPPTALLISPPSSTPTLLTIHCSNPNSSVISSSILESWTLQSATPLPATPQPAYLSAALHLTHALKKPKMEQDTPANKNTLSKATALATRTTEDVIADLKRFNRKPSVPEHLSSDLRHTVSTSDLPSEYKLHPDTKLSQVRDEDSKEDGSPGEDEEDEEEDDQPRARPKKVTERKRRFNAIADNYMQDKILTSNKKANQVRPEDQDKQSAKWIVNQSENRVIISSPREYQLELFERAKEKNIIAVLDTGSGKTLIAVLLLRHILAQELEDRVVGKPHRISFFLVDSVALVFQQFAVLKANLGQTMSMFCGEMGCDLWSRKAWNKNFSENKVIVCTAEILRQCLHHSFISMAQINLLIFDEAHHAKKDHSYARIIKDFYAQAPKTVLLPKIFGMTASPVDANVDVKKAAAELEAMLHSEIATTADLSLGQYAVRSGNEQLGKYATLGPCFKTALYQKLHEQLSSNIILRKPFQYAYNVASRELGAWCADQLWAFCFNGDEQKKLVAKTEHNYHSKKIPGPLAVLEQQKLQVNEALKIVSAHTFEPPDPSETSKNLSSKVLWLVGYLRQQYERPTNNKCIVFVKQRYTARLLATLFMHREIGTPNLFIGTLLGTRTGEAVDLNTSFREQVLTMMNFRKGTINCLFATSVAEEGIDVPDCNLIVRFDLYDTTIQYIQSRGRARHANSRYIHMCEEGNQAQLQLIKEVRRNEDILKRFCSALPEDRKLYGNDFDMDYFLSKERTHRVYEVAATGAKLTYKMSLMVLANFVDSLPHGQDQNLQAEYVITVQNKQFIGEVILPEEAPIRGAVGRPAPSKQVAKCSAAFETCLLLRKGKYLDDWLLPIYTKQLPAMRNALLAVDSKKREAYDMKTKPALWSVGKIADDLFLTVLDLINPGALDRPSQHLALLTRSRLPQLPEFMLHFGAGNHSGVQCVSLVQPLKVDSAVINQIDTFTLSIFNDVFSKEYASDPSKMPYFIVPILSEIEIQNDLKPLDLIDWAMLKDVEDRESLLSKENYWETFRPWETEPNEFFEDKFIVDPWDGSRKFWCLGITSKYKPSDPLPPNTPSRKGTRKRRGDNILEYSCSLWEKARSRRVLDENQRVFETELVSLRRNLLDEFDNNPETMTNKKCFLTLETLKISPLPTKIVTMVYLFPAIIHRIEAYLVALEACDLLHLDIRPDLALEAVTKDSDNSGEHDSEKINFQRGMGNNYERLEFLGDCFLKMATSISLYGIHPDHDEYKSHVDRMLLICNKNLCNNAIKLKLYKYIRSQSFNRRAWYPEGLVLKKGKTATAPNTHRLGDKTIADVCEALIGAALLTHHESNDMDAAVRAVTELVSSENHNLTSYADYYKLYKKPKYQIAKATEMQLDLARQVETQHQYHFKWPRLLRSAFVHPSYPFSYEQIPSYQRLEFLGDALLDMICVNFLYHKYPGKDPQWLTEHKMAMVSNAFLGALCVSLDFHRHLLIFNGTFQQQVSDYVTEITEAQRQAEEDAVHAGKTRAEYSPDYWTSVRQPPKCLPDIIEAYIGAIFVDSEYNYSEVERFFNQHIKWYFTDMSIYDSYANKHPTMFLTNFLQVNMGCEEWTVLTKEIKSVDGSKSRVLSMVVVHDKVIADAEAESSRYAKITACKEALTLLDGLPLVEFREKYGCGCRPSEDDEAEASKEDLHGTVV